MKYLNLFLFVLTISACNLESNSNQTKLDSNLMWRIDSSRQLLIKDMLGYGREDTLDIQRIEYYDLDTNEILIESIRYGSIVYDIQVRNKEKYTKHFIRKSKDSELGFELFHSNCGSCHYYFKTSAKDTFKSKIVELDKNKELFSFVKKETKFNNPLHLYHPSHYHLDSFEVSLIFDYITNLGYSEVVY